MRLFLKTMAVLLSMTVFLPNISAAKEKAPVPGLTGVYRLVTAPEGPYKGDLVLDLGFSQYFKFGNMNEFKAGELIHAAPVRPSKKGLATRFHFKRVHPQSYLENVHLNVGDQYVVADKASLYTYPAYLTEVLDHRTFRAVLDLGFGITVEKKLRLESSVLKKSVNDPSRCVPPARLENGVCVTEDPSAFGCPAGQVLENGKCYSYGVYQKEGCVPPARLENGLCVTEDPSAFSCPPGQVLENGKCYSYGEYQKDGCVPPARLENGVCVTEDPSALGCPAGQVLENGKCYSYGTPVIDSGLLSQKLKSAKQLLVKVVTMEGGDGLPVVLVWNENNELMNPSVYPEIKE